MNPAILQLLINFPDLSSSIQDKSLDWSFDVALKKVGPDFYSQLMLSHPVLDIEYGIVCNQVCYHLKNQNKHNQKSQTQLIDQLKSALIFSQVLEQLNRHYLMNTFEAERLRKQQEIYKGLLNDLAGYNFATAEALKVENHISLTQYIRNNTAAINWYRLFLNRGKRLVNLIEFVANSPNYSQFIVVFDKITNPFFAYLAWCFFVPRLLTNFFLLIKHSVPGPWMETNEKAVGAWIRFCTQLQRRGFEMNNDVLFVTVGLLNCFVLIGILAPVAVYVSLAAFALDAVNVGLRCAVELNRLTKLKKKYDDLYLRADSAEKKQQIREFQGFLEQRIEYEKLRLSVAFFNALAIFLIMALAVPALVSNPVLPLIGACVLVIVWIGSYALTQRLEKLRPIQKVEEASKIYRVGFFASKDKKGLSPSPPVDKTKGPPEDENDNQNELKSPSL